MDGDPSQEDRIRLIGRLFFLFSIGAVNLCSIAYANVFSFMQDLGDFCLLLTYKYEALHLHTPA
jgi:hypothetical protein